MAPKLLDRRDMLFPEAISPDGAFTRPALIVLPNRLRAGREKSLVSHAKIFETFQENRRLLFCI